MMNRYYYVALVTVAVLVPVLLWTIGSRLRRTLWIGPTIATGTPLPGDVECTPVTVPGGETVYVYANRPRTTPSATEATVIYCHGALVCVEDDAPKIIDALAPHNVVVWDYRGFGRSTGTSDTRTASLDLFHVIRFARRTFGPGGPLVLYGFSLGCHVVLDYLQRARRALPDRIVLSHPLVSLSDVVVARGCPRWLARMLAGPMHGYESVLAEYLRATPEARALVLMSSTDALIPAASIDAVCADCPPAQIERRDVGGAHFGFPARRTFLEINRWISDDGRRDDESSDGIGVDERPDAVHVPPGDIDVPGPT